MSSQKRPIAVIYDDHRLFAESFSMVLERLRLFESVHTIVDDEHAYLQFLVKEFDTPVYLFLDYYLPQRNALTLINETRRINKKAKVIVVSSVTTPSIINHTLTHNPNGFISKSGGIDIVIDCLRTIEKNELYLCPFIRKVVKAKSDSADDGIPFTARELEMLYYFAQGLSIVETANKTHLSKHTIVAHRRKMMTKANVNSITELLAYARSKELI